MNMKAIRLIGGLIALVITPAVWATSFYVNHARGDGFTYRDTVTTTTMVQAAIAKVPGAKIARTAHHADFILQPELMRIDGRMLLKLDKMKDGTLVYSGHTHLNSLHELVKKADQLTKAVILAQPGEESEAEMEQEHEQAAPEQPIAHTEAMNEELAPIHHYWTASLGPAVGVKMATGNPMYDVSIAHLWEIHPQVAAKAQFEAAMGSGTEDAHMVNLSAGARYFANEERTAPYVEGAIGYAGAKAASSLDRPSGLSVSTAVGYQFLRQGNRSADAQIHYTLLTQGIPGVGTPAVLGARFGMNF